MSSFANLQKEIEGILKINYLIIFSIAALISGCATNKQFQASRPQVSEIGGYVIARSESAVGLNQTTEFVDSEREIVYSQNFGGGGVGLGLLLGPIGVAANASMIASITKNEAASLRGKIPISPSNVFQGEAKRLGLSLAASANGSDFLAMPYIRVSKTTESVIHLTAVLVIEKGSGGGKWTGRYYYQLPGEYTLSRLNSMDGADVDAIRAATESAYRKILTFISLDLTSPVQAEKKILFKSPYLTPRFEFEQAGTLISDEVDVVWIRSAQGIYAIQKSQVVYSTRS